MLNVRTAKSRKIIYIAFLAGCAIAITLVVFWRLVNTGKLPLTTAAYMRLSDVTFYLCPTSMMLMEVDPLAPLNVERMTLYGTVILLNGVWYALVALALTKIGGVIKRVGGKRETGDKREVL